MTVTINQIDVQDGFAINQITAGASSLTVDTFDPSIFTVSVEGHMVQTNTAGLDAMIAELTALRGKMAGAALTAEMGAA